MNFDTKYYMDVLKSAADVNFPNNNLFTPAFNKIITDTISNFINRINVDGLDVLLKLGGANITILDKTSTKLDITIYIAIDNVVYKTKVK